MDSFNRDQCFACQDNLINISNEKSYQWIKPRMACHNHIKIAKINNEHNLIDYLKEISPVEGSGLIYYINPLWINDKKCWGDYSAGFINIMEEVYYSNSIFEYLIQHEHNYLEWLYEFYCQKFDNPEQVALTRMSKQFYEYHARVINRWLSSTEMAIKLKDIKIGEYNTAEKFNLLPGLNGNDSTGLNQKEVINFYSEADVGTHIIN